MTVAALAISATSLAVNLVVFRWVRLNALRTVAQLGVDNYPGHLFWFDRRTVERLNRAT